MEKKVEEWRVGLREEAGFGLKSDDLVKSPSTSNSDNQAPSSTTTSRQLLYLFKIQNELSEKYKILFDNFSQMFDRKAIVDMKLVHAAPETSTDSLKDGLEGTGYKLVAQDINQHEEKGPKLFLAYKLGNPLRNSYVSDIMIYLSKDVVTELP